MQGLPSPRSHYFSYKRLRRHAAVSIACNVGAHARRRPRAREETGEHNTAFQIGSVRCSSLCRLDGPQGGKRKNKRHGREGRPGRGAARRHGRRRGCCRTYTCRTALAPLHRTYMVGRRKTSVDLASGRTGPQEPCGGSRAAHETSVLFSSERGPVVGSRECAARRCVFRARCFRPPRGWHRRSAVTSLVRGEPSSITRYKLMFFVSAP